METQSTQPQVENIMSGSPRSTERKPNKEHHGSRRKDETNPKHNQAAVLEEHWVGRGSKNSAEVTREVVAHARENTLQINSTVGQQNIFSEHHNDPPSKTDIQLKGGLL